MIAAVGRSFGFRVADEHEPHRRRLRWSPHESMAATCGQASSREVLAGGTRPCARTRRRPGGLHGPVPFQAAWSSRPDGDAEGSLYDRELAGASKSAGAIPSLVQRCGALPLVMSVFLSQLLYFWEPNMRSATTIGAVVGGRSGRNGKIPCLPQ